MHFALDVSLQPQMCPFFTEKDPGGRVLHYGARRGCAPVLGFWPENSGIGIYFHLEFSGIGVYCYTENSGYGC